MATIGVLAVQGGFAAHGAVLAALGHTPREVRSPRELDDVEGLVLPGGESTAQRRLITALGLGPALHAHLARGRPVLATCAGLILLAREVGDTPGAEPRRTALDVAVERNAWGRQLDSFEARSDDGELALTFIRAPRIREVGADVEVLARYRGEPVWVRHGAIHGATFHPELTADRTVHRRVFGAAL